MPTTTLTSLRCFRRTCGISLVAYLVGMPLNALPTSLYPPGRTAFRSYGVEKGLGNLSVLTLLQDREGYLWVGTEDGLYRYDGRDFQRFDRRLGLPSTYISAMHEDTDGTLWVGTFAGLARRSRNGFDAITAQSGLPSETVGALKSTADGRLWVGMRSGLFVHQAGRGFDKASAWPGGDASALTVDSGGRLWAASSPVQQESMTQVLCLEGAQWRAWPIPGLGRERLDALACDGGGRIWVRSSTRLWVMERNASAFQLAESPERVASARGLLGVDRRGRLMVPVGTGLLIHGQEGWHRIGPREGLPVEWAQVALEDREGSLWIGSTGLHRQLGGGAWRSYAAKEGLPSEIARALFQDRSGKLWVGTEKGLVQAQGNRFQKFPGTESIAVRTIQEDSKGLLYLAGMPVEVLRVDPSSKRVERFGADSGLRGKRIFRMVLNASGMLWVATDGGGLLAAKTDQGPLRFESVALPQGNPREYISGLAQDGKGRLWAAGESGLAVRENGQWRRFTVTDGLKQTHTAFVFPRKNGEVALAYFEASGLSRIRYEAGHFSVSDLTSADSPINGQKVYMLGEDHKERLWIGTGQGVYTLTGTAEEHFGSEDGLAGEDVNNMTFLEDREGNIWIGTLSGLARFDQRLEPPAPPPPATVFLSSTLGTKSWDGPPPSDLRLSHRENLLETHYAGLSFLRENAVQSQTRLVGLEPEWRATKSREIRIPALPSGDYRFEVRSRIGTGGWGAPTGFSFTIAPAWWQTWWFRALTVLGLGGLVALIVRLRLRSMQLRTKRLEVLVAKRTAELQAANEALRTQSLTDPLTGLRNRRFLGVCMPDDVAMVNRVHRHINLGKGDRNGMNIDMVFLMVDVDHFKHVNDQHGHHAGDQVLHQLAEILKEATRDSDTVVRWGGEEFLVVARNACLKDCAVLAERIRTRVEASTFKLDDGTELHRTCSIGFAVYPMVEDPPDHIAWEQVVDLADHALYAAKRGGRNAWVGLFPKEGLSAKEIPPTPSLQLADLVTSERLEVGTNLPSDRVLDWEPIKF